MIEFFDSLLAQFDISAGLVFWFSIILVTILLFRSKNQSKKISELSDRVSSLNRQLSPMFEKERALNERSRGLQLRENEIISRERSCREREIQFEQQRTSFIQESREWKKNLVERFNAKVAEIERQRDEDIARIIDSRQASMHWVAGMAADYLTFGLEQKARSLEWGSDVKRQKKVESIREIRAQAQTQIQEAKIAIYQLEYLKQLYPGIEDVLDTEYSELNLSSEIPEHDPTRDYLNKDEWAKLSHTERDQLALDRYINSQNKTKWQIGRDYELSVSYECMQRGFSVDTFGSRMGLEDLGRDIIATSPAQTLIIQCKYWSKHKTIHEKHLFQLYGTLVMYRIDHPNMFQSVRGVFVTNTSLSDTAREVAKVLDIVVIENHSMVDFPRIKCNIGKDEYGSTRIYHLPMDMQYDVVQIKDPGEFYAFTIQEAIDAGFRRAYKWHGSHAEV